MSTNNEKQKRVRPKNKPYKRDRVNLKEFSKIIKNSSYENDPKETEYDLLYEDIDEV